MQIECNIITETVLLIDLEKIIVKLLRFKDKTKIFQNANKLKGQNIFINNGFSDIIFELRKDLMVEVNRLRELRKIYFLSYTTIVSREKVKEKM